MTGKGWNRTEPLFGMQRPQVQILSHQDLINPKNLGKQKVLGIFLFQEKGYLTRKSKVVQKTVQNGRVIDLGY